MAQVGCYVPAQKAKLTPVDRIMSRLGANDNIFASASTFMVELAETKKILSEATPNSLVILDELGRGTSTYDGVAVAHAVLHHLASHVGCIGFFATHYRNLGEEFKLHPGTSHHLTLLTMLEIKMKTMSVLVDEENREVTFLYKLIDGISEKSYGMNVAAMAGVPYEVVVKAEEAAREFEVGSRLAKSLERSGRGGEISLALQSDFAWLGRLANGSKEEDEDMKDVTRRLKTMLSVVEFIQES
jgi:DNA mismatch repair protein MSH6